MIGAVVGALMASLDVAKVMPLPRSPAFKPNSAVVSFARNDGRKATYRQQASAGPAESPTPGAGSISSLGSTDLAATTGSDRGERALAQPSSATYCLMTPRVRFRRPWPTGAQRRFSALAVDPRVGVHAAWWDPRSGTAHLTPGRAQPRRVGPCCSAIPLPLPPRRSAARFGTFPAAAVAERSGLAAELRPSSQQPVDQLEADGAGVRPQPTATWAGQEMGG